MRVDVIYFCCSRMNFFISCAASSALEKREGCSPLQVQAAYKPFIIIRRNIQSFCRLCYIAFCFSVKYNTAFFKSETN